MVHGLRLEGGRAISYRNRWVRTATFTDGVRPVDAQGRRNLAAGVANTHIVRHAGRTLALVESSFPYEIDCRPGHELETLGAHDFGGRLTTAMTAHPKTCPTTGELHFFGYGGPTPPYLTYHRADAAGELVISRPIDVPGHTMMHDFHLTARHVIFMDLPVVFDRSRPGMPYQWNPEYGARLGVLRRDDPYGEVRWLPIDPCYVFHALNAHDDGDQRIVLHVSRYADYGGRTPAHLWRWTIDLVTGTVAEEQLDDQFCEFPGWMTASPDSRPASAMPPSASCRAPATYPAPCSATTSRPVWPSGMTSARDAHQARRSSPRRTTVPAGRAG